MYLSELKPLQKNPFKSRGDQQIAAIGRSIQEFEKMMEIRKIVIDENFQILGGNKRYFALKALGRAEIPDSWVDQVIGLTESQKREFIVKDNSHWGSEWDFELLKDWGVDIDDWGVQVDWEEPQPEASEDDYQIPDEIVTDIVVGDLFEIGVHRLVCGDSTDKETVERLMRGEKADMVFTDPPYAIYGSSTGVDGNIADAKMILPFFKLLMNVISLNLREFAHFYICCDFRSYPHIISVQPIHMATKNLIVWQKQHGNGGLGTFYTLQYELLHFGEKYQSTKQIKGKKTGKRVVHGCGNIWDIPTETNIKASEKMHAAIKPQLLISKAIENSTDISELILDIFLGSGSTMVAAHQLNRKCYGMELEPKYCQVIIDRMRKLDPGLVIKKNGEVMEFTVN